MSKQKRVETDNQNSSQRSIKIIKRDIPYVGFDTEEEYKKSYDLITNIPNEDLIVAKIAIEAAGSEHTVFGNAYNMIGGYMQDHIGIYIQKDLKPSNEVEAVFYAMSLVRRKFKELSGGEKYGS